MYTYMNMKQSIMQKRQPYQRKLETAPPSRKAGFFCQSCYSSRCWIKGTWDYLGRRWEQHYHPTQKKMTEKDGHLRNSNSIYSVQLLLLYLLGRNIYLERQLSGFKCSLEIFKFSLEICSSRLDIYLPSFPEDSSLTIPKHPLRQVHIIHSFIHY